MAFAHTSSLPTPTSSHCAVYAVARMWPPGESGHPATRSNALLVPCSRYRRATDTRRTCPSLLLPIRMSRYDLLTSRFVPHGVLMPSSDSQQPAQPSLAPFPLVGRAAELGVLHSLLDDAEKGRGRTVFLSGEPGIGKTRLSEELAREATRRH